MSFLAGKEVDLAEDTREAEFILILKIRAVAPFEHKHFKCIFACAKVFGYIDLAGHMADLTVCREIVVYKKIEAGVNALKIYVNLSVTKLIFVHQEASHIKSATVSVSRYKRRLNGKGIIDVGVIRCIISVFVAHLPAHRNGQLIEARCCKSRTQKVVKSTLIFVISEIPLSAKRCKKFTFCPKISLRACFISIRNEVRSRLFASNVEMLKRLMIIKFEIHNNLQ